MSQCGHARDPVRLELRLELVAVVLSKICSSNVTELPVRARQIQLCQVALVASTGQL